MEYKPMLCVRYACLERPPAPGTVPKEGLQRTGLVGGTAPSGRRAWGWVEYDRFLTDQEVTDYELEYVSRALLATTD